MSEYVFKYKTSSGNALTTNEWINDSKSGDQYQEDGWWCVPLKDDVNQISDGAFRSEELLTAITLPDAITYIGEYAFANCESLVGDLILPPNLEHLGDFAFYGSDEYKAPDDTLVVPSVCKYVGADCVYENGVVIVYFNADDCETNPTPDSDAETTFGIEFENLIIGEGVKTINSHVIGGPYNRKLAKIEISSTVETIADSGLPAATNVVSYAVVPPTLGEYNFTHWQVTEKTLCVYEKSLEAYQNSNWAECFTNIITMPNPPEPETNYGFNLSGMIDTDYMREI